MRLTAFLAARRDIVLAEQAATYKGRPLLTAPPHRSGRAEFPHPAPTKSIWRPAACRYGLSHAVQRPCHASPGSVPGTCFAGHVPLGPRPSLHLLRCRSPGLVRWLRRYYGRVRLLGFVHHRLRLLVFPMRTRGIFATGQTRDLPVPAQRASTHARVFDHAGSDVHSRCDAPAYVAFHDYDHVSTRNFRPR
jgi:hypothetical protein